MTRYYNPLLAKLADYVREKNETKESDISRSIFYKKGYSDALNEVRFMLDSEDFFMGIKEFKLILEEYMKENGHEVKNN